MKKTIFLSLLGLLFLTGCTNTLDIQQFNVLSPEIQITTGIGTALVRFDSQINNEVSRTSSKEQQENGRKESVISGYIYTYTYKDLGIKITTPPLYDPYFFEKTTLPIFKRHKNIIYNAQTGSTIWGDYIGVFTKDPKKSFEEEIRENHLPSGCKMYTGTFDKQTTYFDSMIGFEAIYFEDINPETRCATDKQFPQHEMPIVFVINPKKPSVYYKLGIQDGCAPGPCSIFGNIEFF